MAYQGFWEDGDFEAIGKLEATKTGQKQKDILLLRYDIDNNNNNKRLYLLSTLMISYE